MEGTHVTSETKQVIGWAVTEIMAGSVIGAGTVNERVWNSACQRAVAILESYTRGEGLFQIVIQELKK